MKRLLIVLGCATMLFGCQQKVVYLDEQGNVINNPPQEQTREYAYSSGDRLEVIKKISNSFREVRDVETGVHYYHNVAKYGFTLSPIYEADGSVRVTEVE